MSREDNLLIVNKIYECFGRADVPGLLALLSDDIDWRTPDVAGSPVYGRTTGKAGALEFLAGLATTETFEAFEPREFLADNDKVVVLGHFVSIVNATGRRWESEWVHIFTCQDGKITGFHEFFDNAAGERAFGG